MNWTRVAVAAAVGAAAGLGVGYTVFIVRIPISVAFTWWLTSDVIGRPKDAILWAIIGAVVSVGITYLASGPRGSNWPIT